MWLTERRTLLTCGLSDRSCALGGASPERSPSTSLSKPVIPAAGSACPTFAFTPLIARGPTKAGSRGASTVAASEPASIGSPSAVPVPCDSLSASSSARTLPSPSAATSSPCCACPLGAVRLALLPEARTAMPQTVMASNVIMSNVAAPTPSARTYPLA
eukprot:5433469-Prymnesium_polylepis.1